MHWKSRVLAPGPPGKSQKAFKVKRVGQGKKVIIKGKNESSLEESETSGDNGFSLAKLRNFLLALSIFYFLLLARKEVFPPPAGVVKWLHFLFGVSK